MESNIFRKKSMARVSSPEQLNDYIKVTTPGVWMILTSIILLLIGVSVWGIFGQLNTVIHVGAECKNGILTCYIKEKDAQNVKVGMQVDVEGETYELTSVSDQYMVLDKETDASLLYAGNFEEGEWIYTAQTDTKLKDGIYKAVITIESVSPISFILN